MTSFSTTDTIVALATPRGRGALGIVRLSGPDALTIVRALAPTMAPLEPRRATLVRVTGSGDASPDQVIMTWFEAPHSYTGDHCVELTAHGSAVVLDGIVNAAVARGARRAGPGEFTLRAYVNGRMDLTQAEAVADLAAAVTPKQAHAAFEQLEGRLGLAIAALSSRLLDLVATMEASLDFPDEGYHFADGREVGESIAGLRDAVGSLLLDSERGTLLRDGATVVVSGRPNTGKSSLFNRLLATERAIVSPVPGTTRDVLCESFDLNGIPITLIDTAGQHSAGDEVEREGIRRAEHAAVRADLQLLVLDRSEPLTVQDKALLSVPPRQRIIVANKQDLTPAWLDSSLPEPFVCVSALTGEGLGHLRDAIERALGGGQSADVPSVTNSRHIELLRAADLALARAGALVSEDASEELVLVELNAARAAFEEVTGSRTPEDVLSRIFERFCIGK